MSVADLKIACQYILTHPWPPRCFPNEETHLDSDFHRDKCEVWAEMKARLDPQRILETLREIS